MQAAPASMQAQVFTPSNVEATHQPLGLNSSSSYGSISTTLVLANNSIYNGYYANAINGLGPSGISLDAANGMLYVAESSSNSVAYLNSTTLKVSGMIRLNLTPYAIMYDSQNNFIYVANPSASEIDVINPATNSVAKSLSLANSTDTSGSGNIASSQFTLRPMAFDPSSGMIVVASSFSNNNTIIDGQSNSIAGRLDVGNLSKNVVFNPFNGMFYETFNQGVVEINLSADAIVNVFSNVSSQRGIISVNPLNGEVFVSDSSFGALSIINATTSAVTEDYIPSFGTSSMMYDPVVDNLVLVGDYTNSVNFVSPSNRTVTRTVKTGNSPLDCCISPHTGTIYVTDFGDNSIAMFNPANGTQQMNAITGSDPMNAVYQNSTGTMYISSGTQVFLLNSSDNSIYSSIYVPYGADLIALDPVSGLLYAIGPSDITVINTSSAGIENLIQNVDPLGILYDPIQGSVYISTTGGIMYFHHSSSPAGLMDANINFHQTNTNDLSLDRFTGNLTVCSGNNITFISPVTQSFETVDLNSGNLGMSYAVSGSTIIVTSGVSGDAYILNTTDMKEQATLNLGGVTTSMVRNSDNGYLYSSTSNGIAVINTAKDSVAALMLQGIPVNGTYVLSSSSSMYLMGASSGSVYIMTFSSGHNMYFYAVLGFISAIAAITAGMLVSSRRKNKREEEGPT